MPFPQWARRRKLLEIDLAHGQGAPCPLEVVEERGPHWMWSLARGMATIDARMSFGDELPKERARPSRHSFILQERSRPIEHFLP